MDIAEVIRRCQAGKQWTADSIGDGTVARNRPQVHPGRDERGPGPGRIGPPEDQLSLLAGIGYSGPRNAEAPSEELLTSGRIRSTGDSP